MATTIGTPAARECSMATIVCGMTTSSAATTSTTTSVAFAPRAHERERFVSRRVEEHYATFLGWIVGTGNFDAVGPDVLRDATSFAARNIGRADRVEQGSLSMVDVTHHGDHRRPRQFDVVSVG